MLSIGIYTYSTKPRGSVVHAVSLAEALRFAGHDVTLYALSKTGDTLFRPASCRVCLFTAGKAPVESGALIRQRIDEFATGLRAQRPQHDIHHAQDCLAANALLEARAELGGSVVRTVHHVEAFEDAYLAQCQRRSVEQADRVFSVSELTRREVRAEFGRDSAQVGNGVDGERLRAIAAEPRSIAKRFGIEAGDRVVLSVGGIEPRKNSLRALAAVANAFDRVPRLRWIIAGGASIWNHDDYRQRFQERLSELPRDLQRRVNICGVVTDPELAGLYAASEVLLYPSQREGFGLSVLEALCSGTNVVASNVPPFTEYLDAECACLVDPDSVEAMSTALVRLLREPNFAKQLLCNGERRAALYSWTRCAAEHVAHYRALLAKTVNLCPAAQA